MQINISWSTLCFIKDKILLVKERILFGRKTVSRAWKNVPREHSIHESGHVNITLPSFECCGRWKFAFPGIECSDQVLISRTWTHPWARPRKTRFWVLPLSPFLYYSPLVWFGLMSYELSRNCFANSIEILLVSCEFKKLSLVIKVSCHCSTINDKSGKRKAT